MVAKAAILLVTLFFCLPSAAFAASPQPARVIVAIVDTGVAQNRVTAPRLLPGWDFVDNDANATDMNGHGSAMASIVLAQCQRCDILPVRVLGQGGMGTATLVIEGIHYAVAHGARIINLSITTPSDNPDLSAAVEWAVTQGVAVVVAAGNSGLPDGYPAETSPDAIAVASVDATGALYAWSNHGPWVSVYAPGSLLALTIAGKPMQAVGTSASAAYVTGKAGILLGYDPALTPLELLGLLKQETY